MATQGARKLRFRVFDGIDLNSDSRTKDPNAWKKLQNLYGKVAGRLKKRPGSSIFASSVRWPNVTISKGLDPFIKIGGSVGDLVTQRTPRGIAGLTTLSLEGENTDRIIGAFRFTKSALTPVDLNTGETSNDLHDALFWVNDSNEIEVMDTLDGTIRSSGQKWFFQPWTDTSPFSADGAQAFSQTINDPADQRIAVAVATNRVDPVMSIWKETSSNDDLKAGNIHFLLDGVGNYYMKKVRHIVEYAGTLVFGGFQLRKVGIEDLDDQSHFIVFADSTDLSNIGSESSIRIGASPAEPITALGLVTIRTDDVGEKAQLACFTARRMVTFDGIPPQDETAGGVDFTSIVNAQIGTVSPNAVVQTPQGLVFLGTDGVVYLVRPSDRPRPIGRAILPALEDMTNEDLEQAAAVYDRGFYKLALNTREQYWADLRFLRFDDFDLGVKWSGPHLGMRASVFAVGRGYQDAREVYFGDDVVARVDKVDEDLTQDNGTDIAIRAESPEMDMGDAHLDKTLVNVELGFHANKSTTVDITAHALSSTNCSQSSENWSESASICGPTWGGFDYNLLTADDVVFYGSEEDYVLLDLFPTGRRRGRMFKVTITEDSDAEVEFFDFSITLRPHFGRN